MLLPIRIIAMPFIWIACSIALASPIVAAGQAASAPLWPIGSGSRVRILASVLGEKKAVGTLVSATRDTIVFQLDDQPSVRLIGVTDIRQIEIPAASKTHKLTYGLLGLLVGAAAGGFIGHLTYTAPPCQDAIACIAHPIFGDPAQTAGGVIAGGALGGVVGALIGARHAERWASLPVPIPR